MSEDKKQKTAFEKLKEFFKYNFSKENTFDKTLTKQLKKAKKKEEEKK